MNTLAPFLHHSLSLTLILLLACPSTMIEAPLDDTVGLDPNLELSGDVTIGDTGAPPGEGEGYDEFFFETTCPEEARQGQIVTCTINLYPPGRYEIRVPNPPKGMALDTDQLLLNWTPSTEQSGLYQFSVEVFRSAFSRKSQAVQIFIPSDDLAGGVDLCKGYVLEGKDYTCTVSRFHATLGGDLTYILLEAPPGMTIDEHQGLLEWTPPTNAEDQLVSVTVRGDNGTKTEDYQFTIKVIAINDPPVVNYACNQSIAGATSEYQCTPTFSDPEGSTNLIFTLSPTAPPSMTIDAANGTVRWDPTAADYGEIIVRVIVQDAELRHPVTFKILVTNEPPVLTLSCPSVATAGEAYSCSFTVEDPDDARPTPVLRDVPDGMQLDHATSRLTWLPTDQQLGVHDLVLALSDGELEDVERRAVTVNPRPDGNAPGSVNLTINNGAAVTHTRDVLVLLEARDDRGITSYCVKNTEPRPDRTNTCWRPVNPPRTDLDLPNVAHQLTDGYGEKEVFAWFRDQEGNVSNPASAIISYQAQPDVESPTQLSLILADEAAETYDQAILTTLSAHDSGGVAGYCLRNSNTEPGPTDPCWTPITPAAIDFYLDDHQHVLTPELGLKTVYAWFRDQADNVAGPTQDGIAYVLAPDTTPPDQISLVINNDDASTTNQTVTLTLGAHDARGVSGYCVRNISSADGCTWHSIQPPRINYTEDVTHELTEGSGTKTVYAWFRDEAGKTSERVSDTIELEEAPPADTSPPNNCDVEINDGDASTDSSTVLLDLEAQDNVGVTGWCARTFIGKPLLSDGCWHPVASTPTFTLENESFDLGTIEGTYWVNVWFRDEVGNISDNAASATIVYDDGQ